MVTIKDVAADAGVSVSTVSYAFTRRRSVGDETRLRILESADRLGYTPSSAARALRSGHARVLGLVATRGGVHGSLERVIGAAARAARSRGFDLLVVAGEDYGPANLADGLLVLDVRRADTRLSLLAALRRPVVLLGTTEESGDFPAVDLDFRAAGRLAVDVLADRGHAEIAIGVAARIPGVPPLGYSAAFQRGALERCAARRVHGIVVEQHDGKPLTRPTMPAGSGFTAVVAEGPDGCDELLRMMRARGLLAPGFIAVTVASARWRSRMSPDVRVIELPVRRTVERAMDLLAGALHEAPGAASSLALPAVLTPARGNVAV